MPTPEQIQELEMMGGYPLNPDDVKAGQRLLESLCKHPHRLSVREKPVPGTGLRTYELVLKDEALGDADLASGVTRADFYRKGMCSIISNLINGHPTLPMMEMEFIHDPERKEIALKSDVVMAPATSGGKCNLSPMERTREPMHVLAKFFLDNGVNFPGSEKFSDRTPN